MTLRGSRPFRILLAAAFISVVLLCLHLPHSPRTPVHYVSSVLSSQKSQSLHTSVENVSSRPSPEEESLPSFGLAFPSDYTPQATDPEWCETKYSTAYLASLRAGRRSYCDSRKSTSAFDCFRTKITDEREDMFCIASKASLLHTQHETSFKLNCTTWHDSDIDKLRSRLDPHSFPTYMYHTGPSPIYNAYFSMIAGERPEPFCLNSSTTPKYTILLKREGDGNLWHSLLEIFSFYLTIDVLLISPRNPSMPTSGPYLSSADTSSTQIVILDDHPDGPYFDLWKLFAPLPVVRPKDLISSNTPTCLDNVIIPLPGGSNPLWRGDWHAGACTHSQLLDTFSKRVLSQYGLGTSSPSRQKDEKKADEKKADEKAELRLTFIDRRSSRRLVDTEKHLDNIRAHFPHVRIQAVDFAAIPFGKQLEVMQRTDILVGVHGAGMTHSMFLPDGSSVVEILPHNMDYKVFRNLAKLRGHRYFSAHAEPGGRSGEWHDLDVKIEEDRFVELVEAGIRAMLHRGTRDDDVV